MRTCLACTCAFALVANAARAQSNTEAGIRAVLSGDGQTAVRILQPLADDEAHPDPVAQFFLALAFEAKPPVGYSAQACGLFLRAARQVSPFAEQSAALAFAIRQELGDRMCVADEHWQGGPPQSFVLGPGHRVVFADTSVTVTYRGEDQRTAMIMSPDGDLKIAYTPVDVTRPAIARRHFFQWFGWMPDSAAGSSSWTLGWSLIEVVGDRWIHLVYEKFQVSQGATRPASKDLSSFVRIRVNASGEAEYEITGGPEARTAVIAWQGQR